MTKQMKISMKLMVGSLLCTMMLVLLSACGKEETKTFTGEQNRADVEMTYTYKGDKVLKQTSKITIDYKDFNVTEDSQKEELKKQLETESKKFQDIKGVKESVKSNDNQLIENVEVDYEKADFKELRDNNVVDIIGDTDKGVSMKKSEKFIKEQGFKEKK